MPRGAGATGAAGSAAPVPQVERAARGQEVALFTRTALQNTRAINMNLH